MINGDLNKRSTEKKLLDNPEEEFSGIGRIAMSPGMSVLVRMAFSPTQVELHVNKS